MININFLASNIIQTDALATPQHRSKIITLGALILGLGALCTWHFILQHNIAQLTMALKQARLHLSITQQKVERLKTAKKTLGAAARWQNLATTLAAEQTYQLVLLNALGHMPTSVLLTSLEKKEAETFILRGKVGSLSALAEYMQNLGNLAGYERPLLQEIRHGIQDAQAITFTLFIRPSALHAEMPNK